MDIEYPTAPRQPEYVSFLQPTYIMFTPLKKPDEKELEQERRIQQIKSVLDENVFYERQMLTSMLVLECDKHIKMRNQIQKQREHKVPSTSMINNEFKAPDKESDMYDSYRRSRYRFIEKNYGHGLSPVSYARGK